MNIYPFQSLIFQGIKAPYKRNGVTIFPLEQDLSDMDIEKVKQSISEENLIGQGLNGKVYKINDELVVKVPIPERRVKNSILQETKKLDLLYNWSKERKIDLQNSQRGIASFFTDKGEEYLISSFVKGGKCGLKNKLNKKILIL